MCVRRSIGALSAGIKALLPTVLLVTAASAQVATNYNFTSSAGSYSAISGGTQLWGGILQLDNIDDNVSGAQTIPAFNFGGTIYTQMFVSSNGFITFGSAPATNNYTPVSSNAAYAGAISAFGTDLQNTNAPLGLNITQREVRWEYVGTEIVVQWKGMRRKGVSNENFNFQMRLNTSTSVIRVIYGSLAGQTSSTAFQPEVGLRGPNNTFATNVNNRTVGTGSENWASSLAGAVNNSTMRFTTASPAKAFTNGLTYAWTPNCTQPVATTSIVADCTNSTYAVQVTVTGLGNAPNVDLVSSVGGLFADNVGLGTYISPSVAIGSPVVITLIHNSNAICSVPYGPFNPIITCNGTCLTTPLTIPVDGCSSNNLNAIIPITFPGTALGNDVLLESVDLILQADLFNNSDFQVRLISPTGQSRNMILSRFGSGLNIGNPASCPNAYLRLIDGGTPLTNANTSNVTGNYAPEQSLAGFTGNPNGQWTLRICDSGILISGALKFTRLNFVIRGSSDPCDPRMIACGQSRTPNSTAGYPNTLPTGACSFNGAASASGVHWWSYTAASTGEANVLLCGATSFNTRISVFRPTPSCSAPTCVAMSDDAPGCPGGSSNVRFAATSGQTYLIAVHGSGTASGTYTISLDCQPSCTPGVTNDLCPTAMPIASVLADGSTPLLGQDNECAHVDGPTATSGTDQAVGLWYSFNAGTHARHRLQLKTASAGYTAPVMGYALYSGTCNGLGATGELVSANAAPQFTDLPLLTPGADYRLLVYNNGSLSQTGTFGLQVDHPGMHDAGITTVSAPAGVVCGGTVAPVVTLKNFGEADLSSVILRVTIDGGASILDHPWSGTLAYGASTTLNLPSVPTPLGLHSLEVTAVSPNGQPDEIAANSMANTNYDASGQLAKVVIHTDGAGADLTWTLYDAFFFPLVSGGPYGNNTTYTEPHCLSTTLGSCYSFFLFDSAGDGLCCGNGNGFWEIRDVSDRVLLRDEFNSAVDGSQSPAALTASPYYFAHEFCLPAGPSNIQTNECGIFTNTLLSKVYCAAVPGAVNYQFEFSDPDAGFLRRIGVPRPWVKFGEMVTVPLQPGVHYFTRVRVDQGANGFADDYFGGGCEMGINPAQVPGCTHLIDNPSLATHSCGVVREFGGSDKLWAQPVVGGTLYRFQFSNPGEGYNRVIQSNNYVCVLNWFTQPLVNGSTYQVRVNVLVNGQWSGFCDPACAVTILNSQMAQSPRSVSAKDNETRTTIYPNPVNNGRFTVSVEGLTDAHQRITIDLYDLRGERVMGRSFENDGELFSRMIDLDASVASGTYLVLTTMNGTASTHRLSVLR